MTPAGSVIQPFHSSNAPAMHDEQIERALAEARHAFVVDEALRPWKTFGRVFLRLIHHMDAEEIRAVTEVGKRASQLFNAETALAAKVAKAMHGHARRDGLFWPPPVRYIAWRLSVSPADVERALSNLAAWGMLQEMEPHKGLIFRRRRFRVIPAAGDVIPS